MHGTTVKITVLQCLLVAA